MADKTSNFSLAFSILTVIFVIAYLTNLYHQKRVMEAVYANYPLFSMYSSCYFEGGSLNDEAKYKSATDCYHPGVQAGPSAEGYEDQAMSELLHSMALGKGFPKLVGYKYQPKRPGHWVQARTINLLLKRSSEGELPRHFEVNVLEYLERYHGDYIRRMPAFKLLQNRMLSQVNIVSWFFYSKGSL